MTHMTLKRKDAEKNTCKFYTQVHRGLRTSRRLSRVVKKGTHPKNEQEYL